MHGIEFRRRVVDQGLNEFTQGCAYVLSWSPPQKTLQSRSVSRTMQAAILVALRRYERDFHEDFGTQLQIPGSSLNDISQEQARSIGQHLQ